jgi:hypothetical protein
MEVSGSTLIFRHIQAFMRLSCRAQGRDKMGQSILYNVRLLMDYENNRIEVLTECALNSTWPPQISLLR